MSLAGPLRRRLCTSAITRFAPANIPKKRVDDDADYYLNDGIIEDDQQQQRGLYQPLGSAVGTERYRRATDPVYRISPVGPVLVDDMAHQYGRFEQLTQFGDGSGRDQGERPNEDEEML